MSSALNRHTSDQRQILRNGINIGILGFGLAFTTLVLAVGLSVLDFPNVAQWVAGLGIVIFGTLGAFSFTTGFAGYFNDNNE